MFPKNTMTNVAIELANGMYLRRCDDLECNIATCFEGAFVDEKVSRERMERIYDKFCSLLLGDKEKY
jgi:hypothetical protein